jgi:hypothetical protein
MHQSHPRLARKRNATGTPKHRHSLRNGLRLIRGLLGVPGDRDNTTSLVREPHRSSVDADASIASRPRS